MGFWQTIWVVLMVLWLAGGFALGYRSGTPYDVRPAIGYILLPWACVAILGWIVLGAATPPH